MKYAIKTWATLIVIGASIVAMHDISQAAAPAVVGGTNPSTDAATVPPGPVRKPIPGDYKIFPGIMCAPIGARTQDFMVWSDSIQNNGTVGLDVICPLVRDNALNVDGTAALELNIWNELYGVNFYCVAYSFDKYGVQIDFASAITGLQGKRSLKLSVANSVAEGYYTLYCLVPPGSRIYSYKLIEYLSTDSELY